MTHDGPSFWESQIAYCCRCERGYRGFNITWLVDVGDIRKWPFMTACHDCDQVIDTDRDSLLELYMDGVFVSEFAQELEDLRLEVRRRKNIIKFFKRNGRYPDSVKEEEIARIEA